MKKKQLCKGQGGQSHIAGTGFTQDRAAAGIPSRYSLSRRKFLGGVAGVTAATLAADVVGWPPLSRTNGGEAEAAEIGPVGGEQRRGQAYQIRHDAALFEKNLPLPDHPTNGDEELYANRIGNYSKGLPHNTLGEVDVAAYSALIHALSTGQPADFEAIPLGCPDPTRQRRLVDPQAGLAFDLEGADSHHLAIPPAPAFRSAEEAGEMVELYWMALARDVPFTDYDTNPLATAAAADLSRLSDFRGPRVGGQVTPGTLFRGFTPGDVVGPYLSQFLVRPIPYGAQNISQRIRTILPGMDYMTQYLAWLEVQNGCLSQQSTLFDPTPRYLRNGRDLCQWIHVDVLFQAYFNACLILLTPPDPSDPITGGGLGAPLSTGNPYNYSLTQVGFGTFGGPHITTLVAEVATRALKAIWYQKWLVHRRLRPEEFGGRVHNRVTGAASYPIHPDLLNSQALDEVSRKYGTFLLPQAFPEGSPLHPSYGAGHATVAGACVTTLKAWFDESYVVPNPVVLSRDGRRLLPYVGPPLTVGGELNKLAANIAMGRNFAGIHWRTDYAESLRLGEAVALSILRDQIHTYNENFGGFTFTTFDGTTITIS